MVDIIPKYQGLQIKKFLFPFGIVVFVVAFSGFWGLLLLEGQAKERLEALEFELSVDANKEQRAIADTVLGTKARVRDFLNITNQRKDFGNIFSFLE